MVNDVNCVVVGGGVAGLSAGIHALLAGNAVTILEKTDCVGGNLTAWKRGGQLIDNCIHWLVGTDPRSRDHGLWKTLGAFDEHTEFRALPYLYRSESKEGSIVFDRNSARTRLDMLRLSPDDAPLINRFMDAVDAAAKYQLGLNTKIELYAKMLPFARKNLFDIAAQFHSPLLRAAITDYIDGSFHAIGLIMAYGSFTAGNGDIPVGGSLPMAKRIEKRFTDLGGSILCGRAAKRVHLFGDTAISVETDDGKTIPFDAVIFACDPCTTFLKLLPQKYCPQKMRHYFTMDERYPVFSALHLAFSCDDRPSVPIGESAFPIRDIRIGGRNFTRLRVRNEAYEPLFSPPGKTVLQVMLPQSEQSCLEWIRLSEDQEKYKSEKTAIAEIIRDRIETQYRDIAPSLKLLDVWTPASYEKRFGSPCGAFMSFAMTASSLPSAVSPRIPGLQNAFLATQWMHPPGGLPCAARAGAEAVKLLEASKTGAKI